MKKSVTAFAPASVSNLACGFDILGFALQGAGDRVEAAFDESRQGITIAAIDGDGGRLPREPERNTAGIAVRALLNQLVVRPPGIVLRIKKEMPFASGMGSSAASAAAAVRAVNHLLGNPLDDTALLASVIHAEATISGGAHADNAAPALLGGLILARSAEPPDIIRLPVPENLCYALLHPRVTVETRQARQALPEKIALSTGVKHWANTAALVHALHVADLELLSRSMEDFIAEPVRRIHIPHYEELRERALAAGALSFNISGSGPAVFSFCSSEAGAARVVEAMGKLCRERGLGHETFTGAIRRQGAVVVDP